MRIFALQGAIHTTRITIYTEKSFAVHIFMYKVPVYICAGVHEILLNEILCGNNRERNNLGQIMCGS